MNAVAYHAFGGPVSVQTLPDPTPAPDGAVLRVTATGLCRSDWHGWRGHDADIARFPHVPGHELAGEVVAVGRDVRRVQLGERVTMPFVAGCGDCPECAAGNQQVCDRQFQPGFTAWGSFAQYVAVRYADGNLVTIPEGVTDAAAASLGCRIATAYRAVVAQGRVGPGDWVAVHGCGGVGLAAVAIAHALGARPIAIDTRPEPLALAKALGAQHTLDASTLTDLPHAVHRLTGRGADVSLDAVGSARAMTGSILSLRKRGRHVQVGLLAGADADPPTPLGRVIAWELEIVGSHGLQAHAYPGLLALVESGKLDPTRFVERTIPLNQAPQALMAMDNYTGCGVTIITPE
ncbi:Alcohol dehydrogenase [Pirellulimonas nuda]|uniref:Alcohol dehydrogenase n=1 Tax=Pirellulimonas nuda TaxID=2528009 RepID=A0A518DI16_9BACT|nr:zinc-dependent alcohol dehydrogenase family protein [Pirellulimonas nuda]QDU91130.1 Alcohol dehydrogenase [Pirellulimonas nuda]